MTVFMSAMQERNTVSMNFPHYCYTHDIKIPLYTARPEQEQLKEKQWRTCLVNRENFIPLGHTQNHIQIFTRTSRRETITQVCNIKQSQNFKD